jgi:hypothetical protein
VECGAALTESRSPTGYSTFSISSVFRMVSSASPTETIQKMVRVEVHYIKISSSHSAKKNIIRKVNMGSTQKKHQKNVCNKYKKNEVHNIQNSKFRYTQKENHSTNIKNKTHQHQDLMEKI